jgi:phage FluMu protein Com
VIRLRCKKCGSFLANVRALYGPFKSVLVIEVNCRNRDCRLVNTIEFQIRKPVPISTSVKKRTRARLGR